MSNYEQLSDGEDRFRAEVDRASKQLAYSQEQKDIERTKKQFGAAIAEFTDSGGQLWGNAQHRAEIENRMKTEGEEQ
jgi:hypothetical protein